MLDGVTYRCAECEQQNLCNCEESGSEDDVSDGPTVLESAEHEDQLRYDIYDRAGERPEDVDNP